MHISPNPLQTISLLSPFIFQTGLLNRINDSGPTMHSAAFILLASLLTQVILYSSSTSLPESDISVGKFSSNLAHHIMRRAPLPQRKPAPTGTPQRFCNFFGCGNDIDNTSPKSQCGIGSKFDSRSGRCRRVQ